KILIPLGKEQRILSIGMSWNIEVSCIVKKICLAFLSMSEDGTYTVKLAGTKLGAAGSG
ncbi:unnamed protein product, partial [Urochloa humidicola]